MTKAKTDTAATVNARFLWGSSWRSSNCVIVFGIVTIIPARAARAICLVTDRISDWGTPGCTTTDMDREGDWS